MNNKIKKALLFTSIGLASSALATCALASTTNPPINGGGGTGNSSAVVAAIHQLTNKMQALATASVKDVNNAAYQANKNLPNLMNVNNNKATVNATVRQDTHNLSQAEIGNTLSQISDSTLTYNIKTPAVEEALQRMKYRHNLVNNLTINLPASDSLYSDLVGINGTSWFTGGESMQQPKKLYNNYFDYSSLMGPTAYTPAQQKAAEDYLAFLTKRYDFITNGIHFSELANVLNKYKSNPKKLATTLHTFANSSTFKQYQLSVRSSLASRSVALSNLYHLMTERMPIETSKPNAQLAKVSAAIGIKPKKEVVPNPNEPGTTMKVYAYASPLQLKQYSAGHRINNPNWYKTIQTASPASIQRRTLEVMAEIENQNYQAHLDRERIIGLLSAMELGTSAAQQMLIRTQATKVNDKIDALAGEPNQQQQAEAKAKQQAAQAKKDAEARKGKHSKHHKHK